MSFAGPLTCSAPPVLSWMMPSDLASANAASAAFAVFVLVTLIEASA